MTEPPIVLFDLPNGRTRPNNKLFKNRIILNLKTNGIESSFYSNATNELMLDVVDRFLDHD